ncbi:MAG TPA: rod shape-determining protein RodA [Syntrophus sp. (in: bacteria)]|jgi:rod shape determining protein RodA|nr:rod shape-determining protein RodA [Syntrophus sp. (in: bacteria)]
MKFDRQLLINFDWPLLGIVLTICLIGVMNIYSTGFSLTTAKAPLYLKQIQWIILGLLLMLITLSIDHRILVQYAYIIHGVAIVTLIFVTFYGYTSHGSQRWLAFGGFSFQPSELIKLTLILSLARYFSDHGTQGRYSIKDLLTPFFILLVPFVFVVRQPDLGTALMLLIIFISMILFVGIRIRDLLIAGSSGLFLAPLAWFFFKDYQKERILTFFDPERDPLGSGYHIIQSMIAIGSGGFLGKGFLKGTQTQLKFLPEQQTDFVFSVFAEEWGFIGGVVLMILFLSLILWGFKIAQYSRDLSGTLIAYGITIMIFWGVFINIGMVLGILPVVGIPLPFLSYGGSSMVVLMMGIGLLINISMRRFVMQP